MEWEFIARKVAAALLLPPISPLLIMLLAGVVATRLPSVGRLMFFFSALVTVVLAVPAVSDWMQYPFEDAILPYNGSLGSNPRPEAIVILGGGRELGAREYGGETVEAKTLERIRFGARLAKSTHLPVLVSGGKVDGGHSAEAALMAASLKEDFGVNVRWIEPEAIDTVDNAKRSATILRAGGISRIVLVTDVMHMHRAMYDFDLAGMSVLPAAVDYRAFAPHGWLDFIPTANAYARSSYVLHEWLGDGWTRWRNPRYASLVSSATLLVPLIFQEIA